MRTEWTEEIERLEKVNKELNQQIFDWETKLQRGGTRFLQTRIDNNLSTIAKNRERIQLIQDQPEIRAHNKIVNALNRKIRNRNNRMIGGMMAALLTPGSITEKTEEIANFIEDNKEIF